MLRKSQNFVRPPNAIRENKSDSPITVILGKTNNLDISTITGILDN